jgi:hypothetical protein
MAVRIVMNIGVKSVISMICLFYITDEGYLSPHPTSHLPKNPLYHPPSCIYLTKQVGFTQRITKNNPGASNPQRALLAPERRDKCSVLAAGRVHRDGLF